jgi:large subunit ribosomal protein L13
MKLRKTLPSQSQGKWYLIDARGQILGRLATQITQILLGKKNPDFVPYLDRGGGVVVINAKTVMVTGRKEKQKVYFRHTGYPGGLKEETLGKLRARRPTEIIRRAVWGMMPHSKLGRQRMKKLRVFGGEKHPYENKIKNQKPKTKNTK